MDVGAQVVDIGAILRTPDFGEELLVQQNLIAVTGQLNQQAVFGGGQVDQVLSGGDAMPRQIDGDVAADDTGLPRRRRPRPAALEDGAHPRQQLFGAEGFGDVVVGAGLERRQASSSLELKGLVM